jgi:Helix-turn-helix domain
MRKLYTPQEYAEVRQCSLKTLERERTAGTGCPYALIGRRIYYREEDIEAFLAGRVRRSTSEPPAVNAVMS